MKSLERVRDLGEVFTPADTIAAMLDLLPAAVWQPHPSATFLEPAAGDGNFLVAILARKLDAVGNARHHGTLPAGDDTTALEFHALQALSSIYAVDISVDNVIGGTPGHEHGARDRLVEVLRGWWAGQTGNHLNGRSVLLACARWIVDRNILVANMLPLNADGTPSGRDQLPLVEYRWHPNRQHVEVAPTSLGQAESQARLRGDGDLTLFDTADAEPPVAWTGPPRDLRDAPVPAPPVFAGPARNGRRRR